MFENEILRFTQAHKKVCDENEVIKKNGRHLKIILLKGGLYKPVSEAGRADFNNLQDIDSSNNKGTNTVVTSDSIRWLTNKRLTKIRLD